MEVTQRGQYTKLKLPQNQKGRWHDFLTKYQLALKEGKDVCTLMDANINTLFNADLSNRIYIRDMKECLETFINDNNLAFLNDEPTRFISGVDPSCIDHIITNCPEKFFNTNTVKTNISDHCCLVSNYKNKKIKYQPKKIKIRNYRNLTKTKLENAIIFNQNLDMIFNYNDPDTIANIFQSEFNSIIDFLAPLKVVNLKKNYAPYLSNELKDQIKNTDKLLTNAIKSKTQDDWRKYRHEKNALNKKIDDAKTGYLKYKIGHPKKGWKVLNEFKGNLKAHPPSKLIHKNKLVSSPQAIANIQNQFYIDKIAEIRNTFKKSDISPIKILEKLRPKVKNKMLIPPITIIKTLKIIKKLKNSNSTGWDNITSRCLKKVAHLIAPHITHLINAIIAKMIHPSIYKISKILPLSKPGKNTLLIDSFRPINNLPVVEKIVEEYFLEILIDFLIENSILHNNHHGGRANHSPETAMAAIQLGLGINCDNNFISTILSTDLSAAYDTVDHQILTKKLQYYGIRDNELEIFKSFFSNRRQFVEIDGAKSKLLFLGNQSVIQGSKLAGILYSLYTNEIPDLHKLIHSNFYSALTKQPKISFKNTTHVTINFVDDSTSVIGTKEFDIIQTYLEKYYCLIKTYYNINKLKINNDKNQVCIYAKSKQLNTKIKNFTFLADDHIIKNKPSIKILGVTLNNELQIGHHLNSILSQCYNRVHSIKSISKYTDVKTRLKFINAHMLSKLYYMLPLMSSANATQIQKVHKLIMFAARTVLGSYCFKTS